MDPDRGSGVYESLPTPRVGAPPRSATWPGWLATAVTRCSSPCPALTRRPHLIVHKHMLGVLAETVIQLRPVGARRELNIGGHLTRRR